MAGERASGKFLLDHRRDFHDHAQRNRLHGLRRITAGRRVTFHARFGPQRFQIHADDAADGVDRRESGRAAAQRRARRVFDVRDVRRHLRPERFLRRAFHPAANFFEDVRVLAHRRAHFAFGQTVRAGKIQFKAVHAGRLAALDEFDPRVLVIFFHDARDEHAVGMQIFAFLKFLLPNLERPVADQLDIFPADDFAARREQFAVTRRDVDDFRRVERNRFRDDRAPAFLKRLADDVEICSRRPGSDDEWIRQFQSVNSCG